MFKETSLKKYLIRTVFLTLALCLALACFAPIATQGGKQALIYGIVFASVAGATIIAYWVYILIREFKLAKRSKSQMKTPREKKTDEK